MEGSIVNATKKSAKGKEGFSDDSSLASGSVLCRNDSSPIKNSAVLVEGDTVANETNDECGLNIVSPVGVGEGKDENLTNKGRNNKRKARHYIINAQTGESTGFATMKEARSAYLGALMSNGLGKEIFSTKCFDNEESLNAHVAVLRAKLPSILKSVQSAKSSQDVLAGTSFQTASNFQPQQPKNSFKTVVPDAVAETCGSSNEDPFFAGKLAARRAKFRCGSCRLVVNYWKFSGAKKMVYSFNLMDRLKTYWTHKSENWEKISFEERNDPFFRNGVNLCDLLNNVVQSKVRKTPYGPNEQSLTQVNNKYQSRDTVLRAFAPADFEEKDIENLMTDFVRATQIPEVRDMYCDIIRANMRAPSIIDDCNRNGEYWNKWTNGLKNITFQPMLHLNQVFICLLYTSPSPRD